MKCGPRHVSLPGHALLAAAWVGVTALGATAQTPPAPASEDAFARLIREYEAQRGMIERPLRAAYAQRLAALLDSLEKRRDPGAPEVAAELNAVQAALNRATTAPSSTTTTVSLPPEAPPTSPLELPGKKARTTGGATAIGDDNSPVHFAGKDSAAEWSLPKLLPGRYRLLWHVACEVGSGATVRLTIDGQPPRTLAIQPTSASGDTVLANLGEFTATTAPDWLRVEVVSLPGAGRMPKVGPSFSVAKVVLIPPGVTMPGL